MKRKRLLIKILLILCVSGSVLLTLLLVSPFLFKERLEKAVKQTANNTLLTELDFSGMDVSFLRHFPYLTISLNDFSLRSSQPFGDDTLIAAKEVSLGINLYSLVRGPIRITRIYIEKGSIGIRYNEAGQSNYNVYQSVPDSSATVGDSSDATDIRIDHIIFSDLTFSYSDPSIPLVMEARGISYRGNNDISNALMKLRSKVRIDSLSVVYDQIPLINSKPVAADLETHVDLNTFDINLQKNDLVIKDIPFEFRGEMNFRKNGYELFLGFFSIFDEEYLSGSVWLKSTDSLWLSVKTDINVTIENWIRGLDIKDVDLRGHFAMKVKAEGFYSTGQNPANSQPDTILLSIPDFNISVSLRDGYFHYRKMPEAISGISFVLSTSADRHDYHTVQLSLDSINARFMDNRLGGFFRMNGIDDFPVQAHFTTQLDLSDLHKVIPLDSLSLRGLLDLSLDVEGKYNPHKHLFPVSTVHLALKEGVIRTVYSPFPIENILVNANIQNKTGELSGTTVHVDTLCFRFLENPFSLKAEFENPENLTYDIASKGSIDLAGIYKLFSRKGMDLAGFISTDLMLKGNQSDALNGRYNLLHNSGRLILKNIRLTTEYLPLPVIIKEGSFLFSNDLMEFKTFDTRYGASAMEMNGSLSNVINYILNENQPLIGSFSFRSGCLNVDEFMAAADDPHSAVSYEAAAEAGSHTPEPGTADGVIVIPGNLEIGLNADLKKVRFAGLTIEDFIADVEIKQGLLLLKSAGFNLIGCRVAMDATYGSVNPAKAFFNFHITAKDFDVKRAYNEVELFRNLSSSAGKCEGIISLDYSLKGKMGAGMNPILPSLEGGGTLTLEKVSVMGLNLFTAMSRNLEREELGNPDLSRVELRTTMKDNVITLEKTRMKIAGFRFRVAGETNFNGQLNLKTRLGLPPLGIIGIPIRILGTMDHPKFKYGRGLSDESVETTEYVDELSPEMLEMVGKARGDTLESEGER